MIRGRGTRCPEHPRTPSAPPPRTPPGCWARSPPAWSSAQDERWPPQEGLGFGAWSTQPGHPCRVAACQAWTVVDGRGLAQPVSSAGWVSERGRSSPRLRARVTWSALRLRSGACPGSWAGGTCWLLRGGGFEEQIGDAGVAPSRPQCHQRSRSRCPDTEQLCLHLRGLGAARGGPLTCSSWSPAGPGVRPVR